MGSGRKQGTLPAALLKTAEELVLQQLGLGAELTVPAITQLRGTCVDVWNEEVQKHNKGVEAAEHEMAGNLDQLKAQGASEEELAEMQQNLQAGLPKLKVVDISKSWNAVRKHASHFLRKFDFQVCRVSKPGKLSTNHPQIVAVREFISEVLDRNEAHPLLVANFDQVWTTVHEPAQRKDAAKKGCTVDLDLEDERRHRRRALVHKLRVNLGLETAALPAGWDAKVVQDDGYSAVSSVSNWRVPRTTTTLSWRNGDVGRLFVTIGDDKVSDQQLEQAKQFRGYMCLQRSGSSTHMWKGATTVHYLDFLAQELQERRAKYGLTLGDKASGRAGTRSWPRGETKV